MVLQSQHELVAMVLLAKSTGVEVLLVGIALQTGMIHKILQYFLSIYQILATTYDFWQGFSSLTLLGGLSEVLITSFLVTF